MFSRQSVTPWDFFKYNPRFPGQIFNGIAGIHENYLRDFDPATGKYVESDPIGLAGGSYSTYSYVTDNPLTRSDLWGLSPTDVQNILDWYLQQLRDLTAAGRRTDPGWWNNMSRSFNDVTDGLVGHHYLGCGEQARAVQAQLQSRDYDDKWSFVVTGDNVFQMDYDGNPAFSHWWLVAKSSNPFDPVLVLDPYRGIYRKF